MGPEISSEALSRLDSRLRVLLDAELGAGNEVGSAVEWLYAYVEVLVGLRSSFRVRPTSLPPGVLYEETRDHWTASGVICDYQCEVPGPGGAAPGQKYWHVLRSIRG